RPEKTEVDMLRPPRIMMIAPRIRAGLHRHEAIRAVDIGHHSADSGEVRIERRFVLVAVVSIAARGVGLPNFDETLWNRAAILVEHAAGHNDTFAERLTADKTRHVGVVWTEVGRRKLRSGDFRQCVFDS